MARRTAGAATILIVELGMLLGIILAAFILPRRTPLWLFIVVALGFFAFGNFHLLRQRKMAGKEAIGEEPPLNTSNYGVLIATAIILLLLYLVNKL